MRSMSETAKGSAVCVVQGLHRAENPAFETTSRLIEGRLPGFPRRFRPVGDPGQVLRGHCLNVLAVLGARRQLPESPVGLQDTPDRKSLIEPQRRRHDLSLSGRPESNVPKAKIKRDRGKGLNVPSAEAEEPRRKRLSKGEPSEWYGAVRRGTPLGQRSGRRDPGDPVALGSKMPQKSLRCGPRELQIQMVASPRNQHNRQPFGRRLPASGCQDSLQVSNDLKQRTARRNDNRVDQVPHRLT